MTRTTLDIDSSVLEQLRRRAAREKKSLGQVASEALVRALAESAGGAESRPFAWTSRDLGKPRIDLEDKEALREVLDASSE